MQSYNEIEAVKLDETVRVIAATMSRTQLHCRESQEGSR